MSFSPISIVHMLCTYKTAVRFATLSVSDTAALKIASQGVYQCEIKSYCNFTVKKRVIFALR
jgi:hypothetical protein